MSNSVKHFLTMASLLPIFLLTSCATFTPGWTTTDIIKSDADTKLLIAKAQALEINAGSSEEVELLIEAFKEVIETDPENYYALWKIGNYHILMGAAYSEKKKDKKYHYREAIKYCDKAMATNPAFKEEVTNGVALLDAIDKLTIDQVDAMGYWYTARFYYFSECLAPLGRVMNTRIVIENNKMIERIDEIDRTWAGGGNYFSRGLYYISIPERFGGSKERANQEFTEAIQIGPNYLVNRWGRAKYLYQLVGDKESFVAELEWVVAQDPHKADNPFPWNVYFQADAKEMLANIQ